MKPGDLVLYSVPGRDFPPMLGIVLKEIRSINNLFKIVKKDIIFHSFLLEGLQTPRCECKTLARLMF